MRRHNQKLHKELPKKRGKYHRNQKPKYVQGFLRFDKVWFNDQEWFIFGVRSSGKFLLKTIDGSKEKESVNASNLTLLEHSSKYLIV